MHKVWRVIVVIVQVGAVKLYYAAASSCSTFWYWLAAFKTPWLASLMSFRSSTSEISEEKMSQKNKMKLSLPPK
jgi:hypothetical protein